MAQNVTIAGVSFENVPSVDIAKTGGGFARFVDSSDANAAASDIVKDKIAYVNGIKLVGTLESGGKSVNIQQDVIQPNFIAVHNPNTQDIYLSIDMSDYLTTDNFFVLFVSGSGKVLDPSSGKDTTDEEVEFNMAVFYTSGEAESNLLFYASQSDVNYPAILGISGLNENKVLTVYGDEGTAFQGVGMIYEVTSINISSLVSWS